MSIAVVTSCSAAGWEEYGRRFVETFETFWLPSIELYLVSEDLLPEPGGRVRPVDLLQHPPAAAFLCRHCGVPRVSGRLRQANDVGWTPNKIAAGYNFRYDAFRFAKKVFAIEMAAGLVGSKVNRLFWLDADVVTFAAVDKRLLQRMLPDHVALSCLERGGYHSECGFVGYNLRHQQAREFIAAFARTYASGQVFGLQEWHDSWVFDWLRRKMGVPTHAIPHSSRRHPFVNSELGRYMDHRKGERKRAGTPSRELVTNRDVPYWRGAAR